jgi:hypothetical protein
MTEASAVLNAWGIIASSGWVNACSVGRESFCGVVRARIRRGRRLGVGARRRTRVRPHYLHSHVVNTLTRAGTRTL